MNEQQIKTSFAHHAATPEISVREYVNGLVTELGDSIAGRHKLYLDTRYWIHLRDAAMGRPTHPQHREILDRIRSLVSTGAAICPVSDVAWLELFKQTDPKTRVATADLLDELSLGIAIMTEQERVIAEIEQFITHPDITGPVPILQDRVWTKAGYILGITVPTVNDLSKEYNLLMQKASVDLFWQITHREMIETAGELPPMSESIEKSAARITASMQRYSHEIRSIQQAFAAESAGALSVFKDEIGGLVVRHFRNTTGDCSPVLKEQKDEAARNTLTMLVNAFRLRPKIMAQRMPSIYANAMCHAAVRMDKSRKLNGHDLLDIHHASSGIPYHDAVFTENPLRVLVTAGNIALDKTYTCTVLAKEAEVLGYLLDIS
ncbi:MAG: hypothetical protein WC426_01685 [Sulfuriferula sp.]